MEHYSALALLEAIVALIALIREILALIRELASDKRQEISI
jgi:hypothetical protein